MIDKRIELITVIQTLCGYWDNLSAGSTGAALYHSAYRQNVRDYFEKYKDHKTVKLYDSLSPKIINLDSFLTFALCLSNPPELKETADYKNNSEEMNGKNFPLDEFINGLRSFYAETGFESFYKNNQNEYEKIINDYGTKSDIEKYEQVIFDYLGRKPEHYAVIIAPLVMGNFGLNIKTDEGKTLNYSLISPYGYKDGKYIFAPAGFIKEILWHEISHLTINNLTRNYIDQCAVDKKPPDLLAENFYVTIESIIDEYIIRAVTMRLHETDGEGGLLEYLIQDNIEKGFKNIESVKNYIIENCEENNKLAKDIRYKALMEYVIDKI